MSAALVYITTSNQAEAEKIGGLLVEKRLAACVNIVPGMNSIFHWEGRLDRAEETIVLAKTKADLVGELTEAVLAAHGYECPCVVALPIIGGNPEFIKWIEDQTR
ncbi:MAG: divalent-cation tolerance protein CutA [Thermodesulfobacteriota bacterium]